MRRFGGFLLIELVLAMFLGALVLGFLGQTYVGFKRNIAFSEALAREQETVRLAANILRRNISLAGFAGVTQLQHLTIHNHTEYAYTFANSIRGYTTTVPDYLQGKVVAHTDVIVVQKVTELTSLLQDVPVGARYLQLAQQIKDILFIADCCQADLVKVHNTAQGSLQDALCGNYKAVATVVGKFSEVAFFISDTGRYDLRGGKVYGLYMIENRGRKHELLEGVNAMQIRYRVQQRYYRAYEINNWGEVAMVHLTLSLQPIMGKVRPQLNLYIRLRQRNL